MPPLKLADVVERLDRIEALLREMIDSTVDPNPWIYSLVMEYNTGTDHDGNGLIYGNGFAIGELAVHVPPSLQPINEPLARKQNKQLLSWESYLETLPHGQHRDKVAAFVSGLPERTSVDREGK
jgi:hypothetical protein